MTRGLVRHSRVVVLGLGLALLACTTDPPDLPLTGQATAAQTTATARFPGGFFEPADSTAVRPLLTAAQIKALVPERGPFTFPAPYNTEAIRLTNAKDCGGRDCVAYVGYSYWRNMNNHVASDTMLIFVGMYRNGGGAGPTLFSYNKVTNAVTRMGALFGDDEFGWHTGEGWYFSATQPRILYVNDGPRLRRYDVIARRFTTVFDVSKRADLFGRGRSITQMHSSDDDQVHSATIKEWSSNRGLGCLVYRETTQQFSYYPTKGLGFDECQVDRSGRWLLIKEKVANDPDPRTGEDNRIIEIETGKETVLLDRDGAGGHSDNGHGYMVAADNWNNLPGALRLWKFGPTPLQGPVVYRSASWAAMTPQHVSHTNARSDMPPEKQYVCGSGATKANGPRTNEIICFMLDGSMRVLVVAPVMTDMDASGGGTTPYNKVPKGNLDVTGRYFIWTSNMGGNRLDAFIVKVPAERFGG